MVWQGAAAKREGSSFFEEKRSKKDFYHVRPGARGNTEFRAKRTKVFCFFFRKEKSSFFCYLVRFTLAKSITCAACASSTAFIARGAGARCSQTYVSLGFYEFSEFLRGLHVDTARKASAFCHLGSLFMEAIENEIFSGWRCVWERSVQAA